jgi:saccharopine dehydrogenase-like NADP-dependent oxidoreductase
MKIAIIGAAGAMARTTILDLLDNPEVEIILLADYQENKVKHIAESMGDDRLEACFIDGYRVEATAKTIAGFDTVINSAQLYPELFERIMDACLEAGCHYNDLGGLFWTTRKLMERSGEFESAGLTAVLCMGSAPGITNVLGRYACDQLDRVDSVHFWDASVDQTDMPQVDAFLPPYSIRTIMQEFTDKPVMYLNGEYQELAPRSGAAEIDFPEPIGRRSCIYTLHSEPATFVPAFKDKGIVNCTWRLGLPVDFDERARFLSAIGFGSTEPLAVGGVDVVPREVLSSVIETHIQEKLSGLDLVIRDVECLRAQVFGTAGGNKVEYLVDCIARPHSRFGGSCGDLCTGTPPSIAAQMQAQGIIAQPGVWGPEIIDPELFFAELVKREMEISIVKKEPFSR